MSRNVRESAEGFTAGSKGNTDHSTANGNEIFVYRVLLTD